jgi:hypothetical protein
MAMADTNSLRAIGLGFGAITAQVIAAAAFVDAQRTAAETSVAVLVAR